jgi:P-type Mg2+ transporter
VTVTVEPHPPSASSGSLPPRQPGESGGGVPFWRAQLDALLVDLASSAAGLTSAEANRRLRELGPATLNPASQSSSARMIARQFSSPLIVLLSVAAVLSLIVGEKADSAIILAVIVSGGALGFWQERRAANAVAQLVAQVHTTTTVLRDGALVEIPIDHVVPGDVVVLSAGATLPGDCRFIEARDLFVDESALTGESFPVQKRVGTSAAGSALRERTGAGFLGTHVVTGGARAVVVRRGRDTEFGHISTRLGVATQETEFERGIRRFGYLLLQATFVLALFVFAVNVGRHRPVLESLLFTLALAVGLAPELLPAIVSITLAHGARSMARARVIVKRLASIEDLGAMSVLCVDKTGTITDGVVRLHSATDAQGRTSENVLRYAYVNASFESGFTNPIDETIRAARVFDLSAFRKLDEIPYDFTRKRLSVVVTEGERRLLITKGAVTNVLDVCTSVELADGAIGPLAVHRGDIERRFTTLSGEGLRCLGVAYRTLPSALGAHRDDERDLTFLGLLALADPPKAGIEATLAELSGLGVALKLVTGDNRFVAATVARAVGLRGDSVVTGNEMRALTDAALRTRVRDTDVFAEVEPDQKDRIIRALRDGGAVVGFLGDGINDATALHSADIGISVEGAVDVTKQAADVVLLDKDLRVLAAGLREGRRAFANTLKYVFITTSANFGNMVSMAVASLFIGFLPLLPKQILLINFLTDVPSMAVATDSLDPELVARPRRWDNRMIRNFMVTFGLVSSVFDLLTFGLLLLVVRSDVAQFRTAWFLESVLSEILVLLVIRTRRPFFRSPIGRSLLVASFAVAAVTLVLPYVPLGKSFGLAPVTVPVLAMLTGITAGYVAASEVAKRVFFRNVRQRTA